MAPCGGKLRDHVQMIRQKQNIHAPQVVWISARFRIALDVVTNSTGSQQKTDSLSPKRKKMKIISFVTLTLLLVFWISCSSNDDTRIESYINYDSLRIIEHNFDNPWEMGTIKKIIRPEITDNSIIGSIDRVVVDPENGDLIIGDFRSTKRVMRFDSNGKFIRVYGKPGQGPAEYLSVMSFDVASDGSVVLLCSRKLMKFSREGELLKETRTDFFADKLEIIDDLIYIYVLRYLRTPSEKNKIIVLDPFFVPVDGIGKYDIQLEKMLYLVSNSMDRNRKKLYFIDNYNLNLNIYNTETKHLSQLQIPNNNSQLDPVWEKKRLSQEDENRIHQLIHRFNNILCFSDTVFLFESFIEEKIFRIWLLNLEKKEVVIFNRENLFGLNGAKVQKDLFFDRISGSYNKGIIAAFDDAEDFMSHRDNYPKLRDINFKADDNPILVFFEFDKIKRLQK